MNPRWIVFITLLVAGVWGLGFLGELGDGAPPGQAALNSAICVALAGILGGLVIAGVEWAMRGDRG